VYAYKHQNCLTVVYMCSRQVIVIGASYIMAANKRDVTRLPHHAAGELCTTRPQYRQGKKLTAVKVEDNCILQQRLLKILIMFYRNLTHNFLNSGSPLILNFLIMFYLDLIDGVISLLS
jgi:hypothetical protein